MYLESNKTQKEQEYKQKKKKLLSWVQAGKLKAYQFPNYFKK